MTPSLLQMVHSLKVIQQVVFYPCLPWWCLPSCTHISWTHQLNPPSPGQAELWGSEPTDLSGTSAYGHLAHAVPLALVGQLNLGQGLRPSHSPSKSDKSMIELTEAAANSTHAQKPLRTRLLPGLLAATPWWVSSFPPVQGTHSFTGSCLSCSSGAGVEH